MRLFGTIALHTSDDDDAWMHAEMIAKHVISPVSASGPTLPGALRNLANRIEELEAHRAGVPE